MKVHPRHFPVDKAKIDLSSVVLDWLGRHDLTYIEAIYAMQHAMDRLVGMALKSDREEDTP